MQYNEKLDAELKALEGDMIETLQRWIRVPSVRAERSAENAPFGADVRRALDTAMADLKRSGHVSRATWTAIAATRKSARATTSIAVLSASGRRARGRRLESRSLRRGDHRRTHDWPRHQRRQGTRRGRRSSRMKAILDAGIPLRRRCRLILGCDEECGMQDLEVLRAEGRPAGYGLLSGRQFPAHQHRKGRSRSSPSTRRSADARLLEIASGTRVQRRAESGGGRCWRATGARPRPTRLTSMTRTAQLETELVGRQHPPDRDRRMPRTRPSRRRARTPRRCSLHVLEQARHRRRADRAAG